MNKAEQPENEHLHMLDAVSMFSNCGAGDLGFAKSGFTFRVLAELEPHRMAVAKTNHRFAECVAGDVRSTWPGIVAAFNRTAGARRPDLLAACPPCQGMSSARSGRGRADDAEAGSRDHRNLLVTVVGEVVRALKPRAIVVENVQAFLSRKVKDPTMDAVDSAANILIRELSSEYEVFPIAVDLADYGIPQRRRRAFLTFIHRNEPAVDFLIRTKQSSYPIPLSTDKSSGTPLSIRAALADHKLEKLEARRGVNASGSDALHQVPVWSERQYAMVAAIAPASGRSAWQNSTCQKCGRETRDDKRLRCSRCGCDLLRPMVIEKGRERLVRGFKNSSYRRMHPDSPAATITTASGRVGSDYTLHPFENRVLSPRECCILQTIPQDFSWGDSLNTVGMTEIRAMIGEAVPPLFTYAHGRVIRQLLESGTADGLLSADDRRCVAAYRKLAGRRN